MATGSRKFPLLAHFCSSQWMKKALVGPLWLDVTNMMASEHFKKENIWLPVAVLLEPWGFHLRAVHVMLFSGFTTKCAHFTSISSSWKSFLYNFKYNLPYLLYLSIETCDNHPMGKKNEIQALPHRSLVHTHAKAYGGHNNLNFTIHPFLLDFISFSWFKTCRLLNSKYHNLQTFSPSNI